eukprot:3084778-Rhodomonas_salina.1
MLARSLLRHTLKHQIPQTKSSKPQRQPLNPTCNLKPSSSSPERIGRPLPIRHHKPCSPDPNQNSQTSNVWASVTQINELMQQLANKELAMHEDDRPPDLEAQGFEEVGVIAYMLLVPEREWWLRGRSRRSVTERGRGWAGRVAERIDAGGRAVGGRCGRGQRCDG